MNPITTILYITIFGLCFLNLAIVLTLFLVGKYRDKHFRDVVIFWLFAIIYFVIQFWPTKDEFYIAFNYSAAIIPVFLISKFSIEVAQKKPRTWHYLTVFALAFILMLLAGWFKLGFIAMTLPLAISFLFPLMEAFYISNIKDRKKTSSLQKVMGYVLLFWSFKCLTFVFFRLDEANLFWGWSLTYIAFNAISIFLPALILEESKRQEADRLNEQVTLKTQELDLLLQKHQNLLRIIIHDLNNPLFVNRIYVSDILKKYPEYPNAQKLLRTHSSIESILKKVREEYTNAKFGEKSFTSIEDALQELATNFEEKLNNKKITLNISKETLPTKAKIEFDPTLFVHSVLGNLLQNAIKFSAAESSIQVNTQVKDEELELSITDNGPGLSPEVIQLFETNHPQTPTIGTNGEKGLGLGLLIVKDLVESNQGVMLVQSNQDTHNSGTKFIITFPFEQGEVN